MFSLSKANECSRATRLSEASNQLRIENGRELKLEQGKRSSGFSFYPSPHSLSLVSVVVVVSVDFTTSGGSHRFVSYTRPRELREVGQSEEVSRYNSTMTIGREKERKWSQILPW